ncbi:RNA-binding protein [Clostridium aceticum]|uniref:RNA-binding protein n=1 Tax=Clostridium aceticum TaxID=84022 RepID=A0A0D8I8T3_9CLOT|nr:S1-like domain-containing RNA-binding protein [Clostridium aceticum]AKL96281.1 RNA-binding protein [Clostridium aceticum]KJF26678.1 RNA-binding protein [Clostridium aceticum]
MIELGEVQKLEVVKSSEYGVYLSSKKDKNNSILLPKKQVPEGVEIGDEIEVFVYKDSEDRLIATTKKPKIKLGELAALRVVEVTKIGAFLDWGLEKDLLLPFKEQKGEVQEGSEYLVGLYIDKSDRLCATMEVHKLLSSESPYKKDDRVRGRIYGINEDIGAFVAIDNKYQGLIPKNELYGEYAYGDEVEARVTKVKEDGKLDLSLREKAYKQMDEDVKLILEKLKLKGGILLLKDDSDPEKIKKELNISKRAFKRAVGRLLKEGQIHLDEKGIKLIER